MVGRGAWGDPFTFVRRGRSTRSFRGRPLKVLLWNESLTGGGCERNLVELACHFDRREVEPVVGIYAPDLHYVPQLEQHGVLWFLEEKRGKVDVDFYHRLIARLRQERPDIIHAFMPTPGFWAKVSRIFAGFPPLVMFHGTIGPTRAHILTERFLHRSVAAVIANSSLAREQMITQVGFAPERVHLIYNGVDLDTFRPLPPPLTLRRSLGVPEEVFLLSVVARVRGEKNHACLVRALLRLHHAGELPSDFWAIFVGRRADEDLIQHLEGDLRAAGLGDRMRFVGARTDVPEVLSSSDVMVLPSFFEGCPNAVQEAMACGIPVVASAVSDNAKLIHEGDNGYLFPVDDDAALADRLMKVYRAGRQGRARMGEEGRRIITDGYTMESYTRATLAVYQRALEG